MADKENGLLDTGADLVRAGFVGKALEGLMSDELTDAKLQQICEEMKLNGIGDLSSEAVGQLLEAIACAKASGANSVHIALSEGIQSPPPTLPDPRGPKESMPTHRR